MKKAKGGEYAPRDKPKKRPGKHKKSKSKSEKLNNKNKKYKFDKVFGHSLIELIDQEDERQKNKIINNNK